MSFVLSAKHLSGEDEDDDVIVSHFESGGDDEMEQRFKLTHVC